MMKLEDRLKNKRVIICCGTGGVGKTTSSAALGILGASLGKKTIVLTIDPAKRLATSLGLESLKEVPVDITPLLNEQRKVEGKPALTGSLKAVMPDTTKTLEQFVRAMAKQNEKAALRVFKTSIYKIFAQDFTGTNEYMAMEKLYQLYTDPQYDLVILDTPPSSNTKLFLQAPDLLSEFFDDSIVKFFIRPGGKLMSTAIEKALSILESLTGKGFITELLEFAQSMFAMRNQFLENLSAVKQLLRQSDVEFLMVTSPERFLKEDTQEFVKMLHEKDFPFWGFIVNRVYAPLIGLDPLSMDLEKTKATFQGDLTETDRKLVEDAFRLSEDRLSIEKTCVNALKKNGSNAVFIPEQAVDVHSIQALMKLAKSYHFTSL